MAQSVRMNEMEEYIKKMGELLNVVYRKASDAESKVYALEAGLSKLSSEVEALKAEKRGPEKTSYLRKNMKTS